MEGINSRLDGLQAAILSAKLPYILEWTDKRIACATLYNKHLAGIKELILPLQRPKSKHTYHLYVVQAQERDLLLQHLKEKEIETVVHYPVALPNLPAYRYLEHSPGDFPVATKLQSEILSLPLYPELTEDQIVYVSQMIRSFYN